MAPSTRGASKGKGAPSAPASKNSAASKTQTKPKSTGQAKGSQPLTAAESKLLKDLQSRMKVNEALREQEDESKLILSKFYIY
jgi:hypothetical protein